MVSIKDFRFLAADYPILKIFTIPKFYLGRVFVSIIRLVFKALREFPQFDNVANFNKNLLAVVFFSDKRINNIWRRWYCVYHIGILTVLSITYPKLVIADYFSTQFFKIGRCLDYHMPLIGVIRQPFDLFYTIGKEKKIK